MAASAVNRIDLGASAGGLIVGVVTVVALSNEYRVIGVSTLTAGITAVVLLFPGHGLGSPVASRH